MAFANVWESGISAESVTVPCRLACLAVDYWELWAWGVRGGSWTWLVGSLAPEGDLGCRSAGEDSGVKWACMEGEHIC
jgi:hypothetical protein